MIKIRFLFGGCMRLMLAYLVATAPLGAQQYPLFTNYLTNNIGFNPAVVTVDEAVNARIAYRSQWAGLEGAPTTGMASIYGKLKKKPLAFGVIGVQDRLGELDRVGGSGILGVTQQLGEKTHLGVAFSGGYFQTRLSEKFRATNPNDPMLAAGIDGINFGDFSAGLLLRSGGLQWGFSIPHFLNPKLDFSGTNNGKTVLKRHYYNYLSYRLPLSDKIAVEPGTMLKVFPGQNLQWDVMARLIMNNSFILGANYRNKDAISAVVGIDYSNILLYYGYDITTSKLSAVQNGSHEITLGLRFGAAKDRDKDGIIDKDDKCPDVPGVAANNGCPADDRDQDGIVDALDKCPDVAGVKENEGCPEKDRDQDGVTDDKDKCPDEKGEIKFEGCPDKTKDSDKDGVPDVEDQCPNQPGLKSNAGCPFGDSDNDGLRDDVDRCPQVAGTVENMGCPLGDRDQDGILDSVDPCPDEAGSLANSGCPPGKGPNALTSDRDGDGVMDSNDKCPNTPGNTADGCPEIVQEAVLLLETTIKNVYFDFDKAEIRYSSLTYLDKLAQWMQEHPEYKLYMAGHTDSRGEDGYNMALSKNRVNAVRNYLTAKGIPFGSVRIEWYGESKPISSNLNEAGRQRNRRVEMKFEFD